MPTIQTHHDLIGPFSIGMNPSAPDEIDGWGFPHNALSSNVKVFWPSEDMAKVQLVRWVLVWNDNQNVMARLVAFNEIVRPITDETFVQLGLIDVHPHDGPSVGSADVTDRFNSEVLSFEQYGKAVQVGVQIKRKSAFGRWPILYSINLEIVWKF